MCKWTKIASNVQVKTLMTTTDYEQELHSHEDFQFDTFAITNLKTCLTLSVKLGHVETIDDCSGVFHQTFLEEKTQAELSRKVQEDCDVMWTVWTERGTISQRVSSEHDQAEAPRHQSCRGMDEKREWSRDSAQGQIQRVRREESTAVDEQTAKTLVPSRVGPAADNPERRHHDRADGPERDANSGTETRDQTGRSGWADVYAGGRDRRGSEEINFDACAQRTVRCWAVSSRNLPHAVQILVRILFQRTRKGKSSTWSTGEQWRWYPSCVNGLRVLAQHWRQGCQGHVSHDGGQQLRVNGRDGSPEEGTRQVCGTRLVEDSRDIRDDWRDGASDGQRNGTDRCGKTRGRWKNSDDRHQTDSSDCRVFFDLDKDRKSGRHVEDFLITESRVAEERQLHTMVSTMDLRVVIRLYDHDSCNILMDMNLFFFQKNDVFTLQSFAFSCWNDAWTWDGGSIIMQDSWSEDWNEGER